MICELGCSCGRHSPVGKNHGRGSRLCPPGCQCSRHTRSGFHGRTGPIRGARSGKASWFGGAAGNFFATILCPIGYEREVVVQWGPNPSDRYRLDFAHWEAKVNIELDGPYHESYNDSTRDARLRSLGWKVIRIQHDQETFR